MKYDEAKGKELENQVVCTYLSYDPPYIFGSNHNMKHNGLVLQVRILSSPTVLSMNLNGFCQTLEQML